MNALSHFLVKLLVYFKQDSLLYTIYCYILYILYICYILYILYILYKAIYCFHGKTFEFSGLQKCQQAKSPYSEEPSWSRASTKHSETSPCGPRRARPYAEHPHPAHRHHSHPARLLPSLLQAVQQQGTWKARTAWEPRSWLRETWLKTASRPGAVMASSALVGARGTVFYDQGPQYRTGREYGRTVSRISTIWQPEHSHGFLFRWSEEGLRFEYPVLMV